VKKTQKKRTKMSAFDDEEIDLSSAIAPEDPVEKLSVNRNRFAKARHGVNGFAIFPLWAAREIANARAHYAFALTIVLLQRMRVRRADTAPITAAIWSEIGSPSKDERQTILRHLRRIPGVLKLEKRHEGYTRYRVTLGDLWEGRR
jgi:hypothetical protein